MKQVIIAKIRNESLEAQLGLLYEIFKDKSPGEDLEFNLYQVEWICPLVILPISAYINNTHSSYKLEDCKIKSYLQTMKFPVGVDSVDLFEQAISNGKSYIPITVLKQEAGATRDKLETLFQEKISEILGNIKGAESAISYPITELVTNIFEHSKKDVGFICAQIYPSKQYLDICIVDCGRGFAKTYKEERGIQLSDGEALIAAMEGKSTKPDPENKRGTGIRTSKDIICKGLKTGKFILISGSMGLVIDSNTENLVSFPQFYWQGTIVAFRIPKPSNPIDIYKFIR